MDAEAMRAMLREELKLHINPDHYVTKEAFTSYAKIVDGLVVGWNRLVNVVMGTVVVALLGLVIGRVQ